MWHPTSRRISSRIEIWKSCLCWSIGGCPILRSLCEGWGILPLMRRQGTALAVPKSNSEKGASAPEVRFSAPAPHPLPPPIEVAEFLSENDVRMALTRNRKLYIGPKTILTPSARDLGNEHDIFIMTDIVPTTKKRYSES